MLGDDFVSEWLAKLDDDDPEVRKEAAYRLGSSGRRPAVAVPKLIDKLADIPIVSSYSVYAISEIRIGSHAGSQSFLELLLNRNPSLRDIALRCINCVPLESWEAVAPVVKLLEDDDDEIAAKAARTLMPMTEANPLLGTSRGALERARAEFSLEPGDQRSLLAELGVRVQAAALTIAAGLTWDAHGSLIVDQLNSTDPLLQRAAIVASAWAGPISLKNMGALIGGSRNTGCRRIMTIALKYGDSESSYNALCQALEDPSRNIRREALESLAYIGHINQILINMINKLLLDGDQTIRLAAAQAIEMIRPDDPECARTLIDVIRYDPDELVCSSAASAMDSLSAAVRIPERDLQNALIRLINRLDRECEKPPNRSDLEISFVGILSASTGPLEAWTRDHFLLMKFSRNATVRRLVANALGHYHDSDRDSVDFLADSVSDRDADVRAAAEEALERLGPDAASAALALAGALQDDRSDVRLTAAKALGRIGPKGSAAMSFLQVAMDDSDTRVGLRAAEALTLINPSDPASLGTLIAHCNDLDPTLRRIAFEALGRLGPTASIAVPFILQCLQDYSMESDYSRQIRSVAENALASITAQRARN